MISRMTTVGSLKTYRYNLNRSTYTMNQSMNRVITGRQFSSFAESPAIAARTFQLRRAYLRASSQYTANDAAVHKFDQAWASLDSVESDIDTITDDNGFMSILRGMNDADASARNALGQSMAAKAKSIVQTMNGRYGENYIFSGADTLNVPFTWVSKESADYIENPDPNVAPGTEGHEEDYKAFKYIKPDGTYTNNRDEAEFIAAENPDFNQDITWQIDQDILACQKAYDAAAADPDTPEEELKDLELDLSNALYRMEDKEYGKYFTPDGGKIGYEDFDPTTADNQDLVRWDPVENEDYDDKYAFRYIKPDGSYTNEASQASQILCYRGVPVDSQEEEDLEKLGYYDGEEKKYIDVGLGYKEKDGKVVSSSVTNIALQGMYYLGGYGTNKVKVPVDEEDPSLGEYEFDVPENVVSVMNRISEILLACDPKDGHFASDKDEAEFSVLADKFEKASSLVKQRYVELDTQTSFLKDNGELLIDNCDSLQDQFLGLEDVDPAAAISDFMFAKYCYDTALKVGNSVLSQSLMDYMSF